MSDLETQEKPKCTFLFKKRNPGKQAMRKRHDSTSENSSDDNSSVVKPTPKKTKSNPNIQMSNRKKKGLDEGDGHSSTDSDEVLVNYKSKRLAMPEGPSDQGATRTLETETETDRDAQAIFEKKIKINDEKEADSNDSSFAQYYKPTDSASSSSLWKGPIRAPTNLRSTVRWDYQPDICKDYKETGFCGFGDSCKFLHDRSDYKHGWQLENSSDSDDEKYEINCGDSGDFLSEKCLICGQPFVDPVVTKCMHYYCEKCLLERFKKTTRCYVCRTQTSGIFKCGKDILAKQKEQDRVLKEELAKRPYEDSSSDSD